MTSRSPHLCRSTRRIDQATTTVPLLPPIDQWGYIPFPVQRLTPHSLSRRVRDLLAGDLGAHRDLPVDPRTRGDHPEKPAGRDHPGRCLRTRWTRWPRWNAAGGICRHLAGVTDMLTDVERRADELNRRAAELVEGWL